VLVNDPAASELNNVAYVGTLSSKRFNISGKEVGDYYKGIVIEQGKKHLQK
jgi:hypothetical protein